MASKSLIETVRAGETVYLGWVGNPDPLVAETIARAGFGAINLDMQHGLHDPVSVMRAIGSVSAAGVPVIVRVPVGDFAMASRALDMGAQAVIAPMVNTVADARAFAEAMKYPPIGKRSWGPTRAMMLTGDASAAAYLQRANGETLSLAMIETREALDNLEAILDVDGIDGIFVGPSDLSLTLSNGQVVDGDAAFLDEPIRHILKVTQAKGKVPAIFTVSGVRARAMADLGYRIIAVGLDALYLREGVRRMLEPTLDR